MAVAASFYDELDDAVAVAGDLAGVAANNALAWVRWTVPQDKWLRLNPPSGAKLFRAGNQAIGKTWAGVAEVIYRATGTHPHYPTKAPPVDIWIVCTSWGQSVAIQKKFWELVPKDQLTSDTRDRFSYRRGWGKDNPVAEFLNGSLVRFRTTNQGPEAQAGDSVDYILCDEPPDEEVFRELRKRVTRTGGQMGLTLTPVNKPCGWLKQQVADGMIDEVHCRLEAKNLIPIGTSKPLTVLDPFTRRLVPMDQKWIDQQRKITPAAWAPVVLDGEWETRPQGVFFKCFDRKMHMRGRVRFDPKRGPIRMVLGFDYAAADRAYGHCAALCQVQEQATKGRTRYAVYALDEVVAPGTTSNAAFARDVLAMLERNGLRWTDLYQVHGDNPVESRFVERSNLNMMRALATEMQIPNEALKPRILNAKDSVRSSAAFDMGNQWIYERIASNEFLVHPRCEMSILGYETWDYSKLHPLKDVLDARRYALKPFIFAQGMPSGVTVHLH